MNGFTELVIILTPETAEICAVNGAENNKQKKSPVKKQTFPNDILQVDIRIIIVH